MTVFGLPVKTVLSLAWDVALLAMMIVSGVFMVKAGLAHEYAEGAYYGVLAILYVLALRS